MPDLHILSRLLNWTCHRHCEEGNHGQGHCRSGRVCGGFAANLKHFNGELQHELAVLQGQLAGLGDTWRDQEHDRFAQDFAETVQVLLRFMEASKQHIPYLVRKADRIEEYLSQLGTNGSLSPGERQEEAPLAKTQRAQRKDKTRKEEIENGIQLGGSS